MKIYTLTCINEDYEVLTVKAYATYAEALDAMRKDYEEYRSCFYTEGILNRAEFNDWYARINYGCLDTFFYDWTISRTELAI